MITDKKLHKFEMCQYTYIECGYGIYPTCDGIAVNFLADMR